MPKSDPIIGKMVSFLKSDQSSSRRVLASIFLPLIMIMSLTSRSFEQEYRNGEGVDVTEAVRAVAPREFWSASPYGDFVQPSRVGSRNELYPRPGNLAEVYDRLAAGADRGDRLATCLLSRALALCDKESNQIRAMDPLIDSAAMAEPGSSEERRFLEYIAKTWPVPVKQSAMCRGLSTKRMSEKDERMLQAALLGDPLAMMHFALHSRTSDMEDGVSQDFDEEYRRHAVPMLERSAAMGDVAALRELFMMRLYGLSPNRGRIAIVDADPAAALAIASVLMPRISPEQQDRIASLLAEEDVSVETVDMKRYKALRGKYLGPATSDADAASNDRGENIDIEQCWTLR